MGMICASAVVNLIYSRFPETTKVMPLPFDKQSMVDKSSVSHLAIAGLLVGIGTDLGNGCTSGHGLCGLPRFSLRSLPAVLAFLSTAIAVATMSLESFIPNYQLTMVNKLAVTPEIYLGASLVIGLFVSMSEKEKSMLAKLSLFLIGFVFGSGLMVAGMSQR